MNKFDCVVLILLGYALSMVSLAMDGNLSVPGGLACMSFSAHGVYTLWRL